MAITVVMEQSRKYYLLVEKEAVKLQAEDEENQAVLEEEQSTSVNHLSSPPQMDIYKTTSMSKEKTSTMSKASETMSEGTKNRTTTLKTSTMSKSNATTKEKSKETEAKSKKAWKRNLVYDLTFSSSSDECVLSKKSKVSEHIPDTQTLRRQLTTLRLSPSQEESILNANRRGRRSLSLKSRKKTEDLLEGKSGDEGSEISDSTEEPLLRCVMGENSKTSLVEGKVKQDVMEDNWDGNEFTELQIEVLEKLESSELNKSTATSTTTIKTESVSDDDIVFVGYFISGTYEGPRAVKETIQQEYISPEALMGYNKSAVAEEKIVPVKEVLANIYDVRNVYTADELAELLCGSHGQRYQKNIDMVDKLKKSIVA